MSADDEVQLPEEILGALSAEATTEARLERLFSFMQEVLNRERQHHFREFWEARKYALHLFKEKMNTAVRTHLWARYTELCHEAQRRKSLFDKESAFLAEQIEMAIQAIEDDLKAFSEAGHGVEALHMEEFEESYTMRPHAGQYSTMQGKARYLNIFATRFTGIKRELIDVEIRLKVKNRLFQHLNRVGNSLFPRRTECMNAISDSFRGDVESFILGTCIKDMKTPELFESREEIKRLQRIAKMLSLSTAVFSSTQQQLAHCWDAIEEAIKARKKGHLGHPKVGRPRDNRGDMKKALPEGRSEIRAELDRLRKVRAASGHDIARAIAIDEEIEELKNRLENGTHGL